MLVVELVIRLRDLRRVARDHERLVALARLVHRLREARQQPQQRLRFVVAQRGVVGRFAWLARLAQHRAAARVRVLHVGRGLAVEVERAVPAEVDVLDAAVLQVGVDDRADADLARDLFLVGQVRGFFLDDLPRLVHRAPEQVVQIHDVALARGQRLSLVADHAEGHVLHVLRPRVAHLLHDLEQLAEVQILLVRHDVQALVKAVRLLAVQRGRQVARGVERGAVLLEHEEGRHVLLGQIHDLGTLALHEQALAAQLFDDRAHLVHVEALARIRVKRHAQQVVHPLRVLERHVLEPVEDGQRLFVALLDLLEPRAALVVQRRVRLGLLMEAHVQVDQRLHAARLHVLLAAPLLVGADHLAKLRAPVAQVVDAHRPVAGEVIDAPQRMADHRRGQVPDVEALGDVDGAVVQADRLARAHVRRAPAAGLRQHRLQRLAREVFPVEEEVQIAAHALHAGRLRRVDALRQCGGDLRRALAQRLRQLEAGKRIVAQARLRRDLQHVRNGRGRRLIRAERILERRAYQLCNAHFHIHQKKLLSLHVLPHP